MIAGIIRFCNFELDRVARQLRHNGAVVPLEPIPLDLLFLLLEKPGQLLSRDEIYQRIWGKNVFVDAESGINTAIRKVRRALKDHAPKPRLVIRVPGKGYRFAGRLEGENHRPTLISSSSKLVGGGEALLAQGLDASPPQTQVEHIGREAAAASPEKSDEPRIRLADTSAPENVEGERKTVTALLADLKGSMGLVQDLDPEEASAVVDPALKLMIDAVHHYEGYVTRCIEDGIFALFGAPVAHEDHPQRALSAALRMQAEVKRYAERLRAEKGFNMQIRVGANTGEVVVREIRTGEKHTEYVPIGRSISIAASVQMLAPPGSITITESVRKLVEGYFALKSLGPARINAVGEPVEIYEVSGSGPLRTKLDVARARGFSRFVGRERELEQMRRALGQSMAGHGQIVAVVAEAGTGKSRLFYEFKRAIPAVCKVLEAYSVSHGKASAWLPVLELLRGYFGIMETDDAASRRDKFRAALTALDPALEDTLPYLFGLLGIVEGPDPHAQMDARIKRQRMLDALKRIIVRDSLRQPVVVMFEDLHWIDEQTQGLLDLLADSIGSARMLLLFNYRPEYHHGWANKSYYTQLRLDPLTGADGAAMLTALLGDRDELSPLKGLIAERTGGNPFFVEEIVQGLFEDGSLVRNGTVRITRSLSQLRLPPTVQGMLAARVDRLSRPQKDLLQTLAVIGRESRLRLVRQVTSTDEVLLSQNLTDLCAAEFIYEQPVIGDTEFVFKHALTQEVAYSSLLIERRKQLHERVGYSIEKVFADKLDDHVDALAHHYSQSDNPDKAIEYLERAGQQASRRWAHDQAIRNLSAAIERLRTLPDSPERNKRELLLHLMLRPCLIAFTGWGTREVERSVARARELCIALGDPPKLFVVSYGWAWSLPWIRAEMRAAKDAALLLLARAEEMHDPAALRFAHGAMGLTLLYMGEARLAAEHFLSALSLHDPDHHPPSQMGVDFRVAHLCYLAWALIHVGYPGQALQSALEAVARARTLSHPYTTAFANAYIASLRLLRREPDEALEVVEQLFAMCSEYGLADLLAGAIGIRGTVLASRGHEEGIPLIEQRVASGRRTGLKFVRPQELCSLAEACIAFNQFDKASEALAEALTIAECDGPRYFETETHRLRGELLLRKSASNRVEAETCFERAIEVARQRGDRWWELRAMTSLARLLRDTGHRKQARKQLAKIYNWFTEGFDTADLKDAKALLDELANSP
jgi:class 3 adenylate cyclase/DNA-binding winged helix-turn-helix (wHTH) protein/tetratricopeptide (TPR) repeat protein